MEKPKIWYEIAPKLIAIYWWVNAFRNDYIKYAEAIFSEEVNEEVKNKKIEEFLRESKDYYKQLECEIKYDYIDNNFSHVSGIICSYVIKILQINPIK